MKKSTRLQKEVTDLQYKLLELRPYAVMLGDGGPKTLWHTKEMETEHGITEQLLHEKKRELNRILKEEKALEARERAAKRYKAMVAKKTVGPRFGTSIHTHKG